jgi:hypothetical protein
MKNTKIYFALALAITAFVSSCTKLEDAPQFPKSTKVFSVTSSTTTVAISAKDSLSEALTLTWTDPGYSVGLSQSKFSIVVGASGKNFVAALTKDYTAVEKGVLLGKEINAMALKLGGVIGQVFSLDVKVISALSNNDQQKSSNVVQVSVTPYGDLILASSPTKIITSAANSLNVGAVLTWNTAFNGYNGVKAYQLQYAKTGTNFASPTTASVSSFSQSFTQNALNNIALGFGTAVGAQGYVDFRIKASNEQGTILYSNVVTDTIGTFAPYNSIGIIGDFTGWGNDVDLYRPDVVNGPTNWTTVVYLTVGGVKFRYDDRWNLPVTNASTAWGGTDWPSGTGSLTTGSNIPVSTAGYYQVNFNSATGAYSFNLLTIPTVSKISLIGSSTPGNNWSTDLELTQSVSNSNVWTGTVSLAAGELKFRANDTWPGNPGGYNWGVSTASPTGLSGWASQSGGNIAISTAANYFVYIDIGTGEYFFGNVDNNSVASTVCTKLGVIGAATAGGWGSDTYLIQDPANPYKWSGKVPLSADVLKFRANGSWNPPDPNWGGSSFPNGIGSIGGANLPVNAGTPQITFNTATGEYTFTY